APLGRSRYWRARWGFVAWSWPRRGRLECYEECRAIHPGIAEAAERCPRAASGQDGRAESATAERSQGCNRQAQRHKGRSAARAPAVEGFRGGLREEIERSRVQRDDAACR